MKNEKLVLFFLFGGMLMLVIPLNVNALPVGFSTIDYTLDNTNATGCTVESGSPTYNGCGEVSFKYGLSSLVPMYHFTNISWITKNVFPANTVCDNITLEYNLESMDSGALSETRIYPIGIAINNITAFTYSSYGTLYTNMTGYNGTLNLITSQSPASPTSGRVNFTLGGSYCNNVLNAKNSWDKGLILRTEEVIDNNLKRFSSSRNTGTATNRGRIYIWTSAGAPDITPPTWSDNTTTITSSTKLNDTVQLSIRLLDNVQLSDYIFSWDVPGFWKNFTTTTISASNSYNTNYLSSQNSSEADGFTLYNFTNIQNGIINITTNITFGNPCNNNASILDTSTNKYCKYISTASGTCIQVITTRVTNVYEQGCTNISDYRSSDGKVNIRTGGTINSLINTYQNQTKNTTVTLEALINYSIGKIANWTIYFNDSSNNKNQSDIFTFDIANIIPNATNVSITPIPIAEGNTLKGHSSYSDADNDIAGGNQTLWWLNKTLVTEANNSFTLLGGNVSDNSNITFSARFNDTYDWSDWINSSTVNVGDSTPPILNNCTLSSTSITNTVGNTITLNCFATDARSNIQTMVAYLNGSINKTISLSLTPSQIVNGSYSIFSSNEALPSTESYYSISQVNITDSSNNKLSNTTTSLHFSVTVAPSGGGDSGTGSGGGGSSAAPTPIKNITIVQPERCGNFVCESCVDTNISNCIDETPLSCPQDCKLFSLDDTFCTPIFNCGNWKQQWFINFSLLLVISGLIYTQYTADKKKKRLA